MTDVALHGAGAALAAFRHEAFLYAGTAAFLQGTVPFIQAGLDAGEAVLVVVSGSKIDALRGALGAQAQVVHFADMGEVGRNPARIIPAWRDFLAGQAEGQAVRGIGEPVWADRTPDELVECQRHEALLNVAFAGGAPWRLLCPYDTTSLAPDVLREAHRSHRFVSEVAGSTESAEYVGDTWAGPDTDPLPEPPGPPPAFAFGAGPLERVRQFVVHQVGGTLGAVEMSDLLLAVTEVASNSVVHGGGSGTMRLWHTPKGVVCETRDRGWIREPLVGRSRPGFEHENGRGLWMVNQVCDLVQLRSSPAGTVIRLHMERRTS